MNIFVRELKANLKSLIIWGVIVVLFVVMGVSKFSAYYENPEMLAILDSMPPALMTAFSMAAFNLTTVSGFFGLMFTYFALLASIAAAMWGSDIISKEERDRTVEFSLTLPVTRSRLVTAKTAAAALNCVILLLVTWGMTLVNAQNFQPDNAFYGFVAISMLAFFLMQMIFLALGIFLGCVLKRYKRAGSLAMAILLGTYFASLLAGLNENLKFLRYISPFKYFDPAMMLNDNQVEVTFVLLSVALVVAFLAGAYLTYQKRDLYI